MQCVVLAASGREVLQLSHGSSSRTGLVLAVLVYLFDGDSARMSQKATFHL